MLRRPGPEHLAWVLSVLSLVWPAAVRSQPVAAPVVESTAHRHLGFFFRADLGVGYLNSSARASATFN